MAWTHVGTDQGASTAAPTYTNSAVGNLRILEVLNFSNSTVWATSLSGGQCNWVAAGVKFSGTNNANSAAVFIGTTTGTTIGVTPTITWSGTAPANFGTATMEFHSTVGSWAFDRQGNQDNTPTGNNNWPTFSNATGELYWGYCTDSGSATGGTGSGFVANITIDGVGNGAAYNLSYTNGTSPPWTDGAQELGIAILVTESTSNPTVYQVNPGQSWERIFVRPKVPLPNVPQPIFFTQSFDGGVQGVTVASTDIQVGTDTAAFATVNTGGATLAYDQTNVAHGIFGCQVVTGASASAYFQWGSSAANGASIGNLGGQYNLWFRQNLFFAVAPSANAKVVNFANGSNINSGACGGVRVTTGTNVLAILNSAGGAAASSANTIPIGQWFRIEGHIYVNPVNGFMEVKLFQNLEDKTPLETFSSATGNFGDNQATAVRFGTVSTASAAYWMDDLGVSNTGYMGPMTPGQPNVISYTAYPGTQWVTKFHHPQLVQPQPTKVVGGNTADVTTANITVSSTFADENILNLAPNIYPAYPSPLWLEIFQHKQEMQPPPTVVVGGNTADNTTANIVVSGQPDNAVTITGGATPQQQYPAYPGTQWRKLYQFPQQVFPPLSVFVLGTTANVTVNATFADETILTLAPNIYSAFPSPLWIRTFLHSQQIQPQPPVIVVGVTANVNVGSTFADQNILTLAPNVYQAQPSPLWLEVFKHRQIVQPQPPVIVVGVTANVTVSGQADDTVTEIVPGVNADIPVNATFADEGILNLAPNIYEVQPSTTWIRQFVHKQVIQIASPPTQIGGVTGVVANITVSGQADNAVTILVSENNADIPVKAAFPDQSILTLAPNIYEIQPGVMWMRQFVHRQIMQPQPTTNVTVTPANVVVSGQSDNSLIGGVGSSNADISVSAAPGTVVAAPPVVTFQVRALPGTTWTDKFQHPQPPQLAALVPLNLQNIFEGGTVGQTLTQGSGGNTGGASGDYFDEVHLGASGSATFDSAQFAHGSLSTKLSTGATSSTASLYWTQSGQAGFQGRVWFRQYLYFTANPAATVRVWNATQDSIGGSCATVSVNSSGKIIVQSSNAGTLRYTFTNSIPLNQWFRVEGTVSFDNVKGSLEVRLFKTNMDADINSYDETSGNIANINTVGIPITYRFGISAGISNAGPYWMDEVALSNVTWIGPFVGNTVISGQDADIPVATTFGDQLLTVASSNNNSDISVVAQPGTLFQTQYYGQAFPGNVWVKNFHFPQAMQFVPPVSIGGSTSTVTVTAIAGGVGSPGVSANFPAIITVGAPVVNPIVTQNIAFPGDTWSRKFLHPQMVTPPFNAMTLLNNFEGGVAGVNLIPGQTFDGGNTGGISGDFFDDLSIGAHATLQFDNTHSAHGIYAVKIATGSTATVSLGRWIRPEPQASIWFREYLYFTANPTNNHRIFNANTVLGGSGVCASVSIDTTGHIFGSTGNSPTRTISFTNTIPLNQWFRVEGNIIGDPVNGYMEVRVFFTTPDGNITSYDEVESASGIDTTAGLMTIYQFGSTLTVANVGPYWMDDFGVSNVTWLGPVTTDQAFGVNADQTIAATFSDQTVTLSASLVSNITVTAIPGGVTGSPPPLSYKIQPGKTWLRAFVHPQQVFPPLSMFIVGQVANIVVDGSGAGAGVVTLSASNSDIAVAAPPGNFTGSFPSNVAQVAVIASPGMTQVNNLITPAFPGKTWVRKFLHPQAFTVVFQLLGANNSDIAVTAIPGGVGVTSLSGTTANVTVSGQTDNLVAILLPPRVFLSMPGDTWVKKFQHPQSQTPPSPVLITGTVANVIVASTGTVTESLSATANIVVASTAQTTDAIPGTVANVTVLGVAGSIPKNIAGSTANVIVGTISGATIKVIGVTATATVAGIAGTVTERMYVPQINVQVYTQTRTTVSVSGTTANISVSAPAGTLPRSISGQVSNIIVTAKTGPVGTIIITGTLDSHRWTGILGSTTSGIAEPDDITTGEPIGHDDPP